MMERFVQLKACIKNALEEIGREDLYNEKDFSILLNLTQILKPAELAVKELSKTRSNLLRSKFDLVLRRSKETVQVWEINFIIL